MKNNTIKDLDELHGHKHILEWDGNSVDITMITRPMNIPTL